MIIFRKFEDKDVNLWYRKKYYYNNTFNIIKNSVEEDINKYSTRSILFPNVDYCSDYFFFNENHNFFFEKRKSLISDFFFIKCKYKEKTKFFKKIKVNKKDQLKTFFFITKKLIKNNFIKNKKFKFIKNSKKKTKFFFIKKSIKININKKVNFVNINKKKNFKNFFFSKTIEKSYFIKKIVKKKLSKWKKKIYFYKFYNFSLIKRKNNFFNKKVFKLIKKKFKFNFIFNINNKTKIKFKNIKNKFKNEVNILSKDYKTNFKENYIMGKKNYFFFNKIWNNNSYFSFWHIINMFFFEIYYNAIFFKRVKRNRKHRKWIKYFIKKIFFFIKIMWKIKKMIVINFINNKNFKYDHIIKKNIFNFYNFYFKSEFYKKLILISFSSEKNFINKNNKKLKKYKSFNDFFLNDINNIFFFNYKNFFFKEKKYKKKFGRKVFIKKDEKRAFDYWFEQKEIKREEEEYDMHFELFTINTSFLRVKAEKNCMIIVDAVIEKLDEALNHIEQERKIPSRMIFRENAIYNTSYEHEVNYIYVEYKTRFVKRTLKKINIQKFIVKKKKINQEEDIMKRFMTESEFEYEMFRLTFTRSNENF